MCVFELQLVASVDDDLDFLVKLVWFQSWAHWSLISPQWAGRTGTAGPSAHTEPSGPDEDCLRSVWGWRRWGCIPVTQTHIRQSQWSQIRLKRVVRLLTNTRRWRAHARPTQPFWSGPQTTRTVGCRFSRDHSGNTCQNTTITDRHSAIESGLKEKKRNCKFISCNSEKQKLRTARYKVTILIIKKVYTLLYFLFFVSVTK